MKKVFFVTVLVACLFALANSTNAQTSSKCPVNTKCAWEDEETVVTITKQASELLGKWSIILDGTDLIWTQTCKTVKGKEVCKMVDLSGRLPGRKEVKQGEINESVKITALGDMVRINFLQYNGEKGSALIMGGQFTLVKKIN